MTRAVGFQAWAAPCCGAQYAFPKYVSMNFSAWAYWTDGWRDQSPMPNDVGLRLCKCKQFVLLKNMVKVDGEVDVAASTILPFMEHVSDDLLPKCIAQACNEEMEVAARLKYWRHLNHDYRDGYRLHRDAEEAATEAEWKAANPESRSRWDKLLRRKPPFYSRPANSPFTYPSFEPTDLQLGNMKRLSEILSDWSALSRCGYRYVTELAELYREQGRFKEAESTIQSIADNEVGVTSNLIATLINEKKIAPVRYRM